MANKTREAAGLQWFPFPERPPVDAEGLLSSNSARLTTRRGAVRPLYETILSTLHIFYEMTSVA